MADRAIAIEVFALKHLTEITICITLGITVLLIGHFLDRFAAIRPNICDCHKSHVRMWEHRFENRRTTTFDTDTGKPNRLAGRDSAA